MSTVAQNTKHGDELLPRLIAKALIVSVQAWAMLILFCDGVGLEFRDRWAFWCGAAGLLMFCPWNRESFRVRLEKE